MSEGIPKSARDALAKQAAAEPHLSPELLNAYVEQSLSETEKVQVTAHLASCGECREVVFLASAATQEPVPAQMAAAPIRNIWQPAVAAPPASPQGGAVLEPRPKRTNPWWRWALPLTAVVVLGATALIERANYSGSISTRRQIASKQKPAEAQPNPAGAAAHEAKPETPAYNVDQLELRAKAATQSAKKDARTEARLDNDKHKEEAELRDNRAQSEISSNLQNAPSTTVAKAAAANERMPSLPPPPTSASRSAEATASAPAAQADNADLIANAAPQSLKPEGLAKSLASNQPGTLSTMGMAQRTAPVKMKWRISEDGHVEHTVGPNTWTRVMAAEPVNFRVVATVGSNVWAGGSEGSLYHSSDGGLHWNRVALSGELGAITTIHFNNAQQGSLTTDSGATWTTSDGGQTWSKQ